MLVSDNGSQFTSVLFHLLHLIFELHTFRHHLTIHNPTTKLNILWTLSNVLYLEQRGREQQQRRHCMLSSFLTDQHQMEQWEMAYHQQRHLWVESSILHGMSYDGTKQTKRREIHFQFAHECLPGITGLVSRTGHLALFGQYIYDVQVDNQLWAWHKNQIRV